VNETNNASNVATIGETISYTITVTVPAMTSVYDASVTDTVSSDGRSYTFTAKGTNPQGQAVETVQIFDRQ